MTSFVDRTRAKHAARREARLERLAKLKDKYPRRPKGRLERRAATTARSEDRAEAKAIERATYRDARCKAMAEGEVHFHGKPCRYQGHGTIRYVTSGSCVECTKDRAAEDRELRRAREAMPESEHHREARRMLDKIYDDFKKGGSR